MVNPRSSPARRPTASGLAAALAVAVAFPARADTSTQTRVVYDDFSAPYSLATYMSKWLNIYGLGDMGAVCPDGVTSAHGDTRSFADGTFYIDDAPFTCAADFSVFDHLKYIAVSAQAFSVPINGSLTFESVIQAQTPGTQAGRVVHGTYGPPYSHPNGAPYQAEVFQGQQAGAVMNMINFATGQLFDWFVSQDRAFALIERLPSSVTGNTSDPGDPAWVGPTKMYTQIITEFPIEPGVPHHVAITYTRGFGNGASTVEYFFDGKRVAKVKSVGVPLDYQPGQTYTGVYPALGPGEELKDQLNAFVIGHGTFSLLDAFPFQWGWGPTGCDPSWPAACAASVSIPISERLFGQGARAHFDNFVVTTTISN
jgi:hypothetical protein